MLNVRMRIRGPAARTGFPAQTVNKHYTRALQIPRKSANSAYVDNRTQYKTHGDLRKFRGFPPPRAYLPRQHL